MRLRRESVILFLWAAVVLSASVAAAFWLPVPEFFKGLASVPAVGAMLSVLVQLWRDQLAHERQLDLLYRQQDFALAAASHMADVAYDKHVAFCETYVSRMQQGLKDLTVTGPAMEILAFAADLKDIRGRYATWLTSEIDSELEQLEATLRKIGSKETLLDHVPVGDQRERIVNEVFDAFEIALGIRPKTEEEKDKAIAEILNYLRDVLGVRELTTLRMSATRLALQRIQGSTESPCPPNSGIETDGSQAAESRKE